VPTWARIHSSPAKLISPPLAQHSGSIRAACLNNGVSSPAVDSLDVPPTTQTPYDVDKNALSIPHTTAQVLNIVYHGGQCSRVFLPVGMNGQHRSLSEL